MQGAWILSYMVCSYKYNFSTCDSFSNVLIFLGFYPNHHQGELNINDRTAVLKYSPKHLLKLFMQL